MPTILSHPAVPLAIGLGLGQNIIPRRLLVAGIFASMLPDLDVLTFRFGVAYGSAFGHRGFTHSLVFALAIALAGTAACGFFKATPVKSFLFLFAAIASHGMLDAFTNGGHGVEFLWPFSTRRFFAAYQVIQVSPIGVSRFLSGNGAAVLFSELMWVWFPCAIFGLILWWARSLWEHAGARR